MNSKARILERLRSFQSRPGMYLGEPSVSLVEAFLAGFKTGQTNLILGHDSYRAAAEARGWRFGNCGCIPTMSEAGLTDLQIMNELIEIACKEIEAGSCHE